MDKISITISGVDELKEKLEKMSADSQEKVKDLVFKTANDIKNMAQNDCPVRTGRLHNSIGVSYSGDGYSATISTNIAYAMAIEYGAEHPSREASMAWGRQTKPFTIRAFTTKGRPFMNPAAEYYRPIFIDGLKEIYSHD